MKKTLAVLITACSLSLGLTPALTGISGNLVIEAEAHPGRTDANGGHRDNKNVSAWKLPLSLRRPSSSPAS